MDVCIIYFTNALWQCAGFKRIQVGSYILWHSNDRRAHKVRLVHVERVRYLYSNPHSKYI